MFPIKKTYNPHFHIIVPNARTALIFKEEWQSLWTTKHTHHKAQHIRKITDIEHHLIETIKYGSKVFTDPDMIKDPKKRKRPPMIYAAAMDNIFAAMEGHRLFDRFGFNLSNNSDYRQGKTQLIMILFSMIG